MNRTLTLAVLLAARAAAALDRPTADELSPIIIPAAGTERTDFAKQLDKACSTVKGRTGAAKAFAAADLDDKAKRDDAMDAFKYACDAVNLLHTFTQQDLDTLRAFSKTPEKIALALENKGGKPQGIPPDVTSSGSLASAVIGGLAQFIYDRAKLEAVLYLRKQLQTLLCAEDRKPFVPNFCVAFGDLNASISLSAMGSYLASAARRDLEQLPDTGLAYGLHQFKSVPNPEAQALLFGARLGLSYYRSVASGRTPLDVARSLRAIKLKDNPSPALFSGIVFGSNLIEAIAQQAEWDLLKRTSDRQLVLCYAVGVYLSLEKLQDPLHTKFKLSSGGAELDLVRARVERLEPLLLDAVELVARGEAAMKDLRSAAPAAAASAGGMLPPTAPKPGSVVRTGLTVRDYAVVATKLLSRLIAEAEDAAVALGVLSTAEAALLEHVAESVQLGEQLMTSLDRATASPADTAMQALALLDRLTQLIKDSTPKVSFELPIPSALRQVIPFLAQVAQAQSADEVEDLLAAAATPADTYEKKYKRALVAINALAGAAGGMEKASTVGAAPLFGAFAPVGVHATTPFGKDHDWHVGGFLSVINVGALVSARFDADRAADETGAKTAAKTEVDFANVLAPGAFLTVGLCDSPFVLGGGVQVLPARTLETTKDGVVTKVTIPAFQTLLFLAIDVPIFAF